MPLFLIANWKWILPSALAAVLGVMLVFSKLEVAALELSIAEQKVEAANQLAAAYAAKAKKEQEDAEKSRQMESNYQAKIAALTAGADGRERDLLASLRRISGRWRSCDSALTTEANSPGGLTDDPTGGFNRLLETTARDFRQLGDSANRLGVLVREVCYPFAQEHGR